MGGIVKSVGKVFGSIMGGPSIPTPPAPPPVPTQDKAAEASAAAAEEDRRRRLTGGRLGTILTSGEGDTSAAPAKKTVLGG